MTTQQSFFEVDSKEEEEEEEEASVFPMATPSFHRRGLFAFLTSRW